MPLRLWSQVAENCSQVKKDHSFTCMDQSIEDAHSVAGTGKCRLILTTFEDRAYSQKNDSCCEPPPAWKSTGENFYKRNWQAGDDELLIMPGSAPFAPSGTTLFSKTEKNQLGNGYKRKLKK